MPLKPDYSPNPQQRSPHHSPAKTAAATKMMTRDSNIMELIHFMNEMLDERGMGVRMRGIQDAQDRAVQRLYHGAVAQIQGAIDAGHHETMCELDEYAVGRLKKERYVIKETDAATLFVLSGWVEPACEHKFRMGNCSTTFMGYDAGNRSDKVCEKCGWVEFRSSHLDPSQTAGLYSYR